MTSTIIGRYGFAVERYSSGWFVTPAWIEGKVIKVSDLASMNPPWVMKKEGKFFPCESEDVFCPIAKDKADKYCEDKNNEL